MNLPKRLQQRFMVKSLKSINVIGIRQTLKLYITLPRYVSLVLKENNNNNNFLILQLPMHAFEISGDWKITTSSSLPWNLYCKANNTI